MSRGQQAIEEVREINIPEQKNFDGVSFPFVFAPTDKDSMTFEKAKKWISDNKEGLENRLTKHGAVLFRGFPINTAEEFNDFISAFEYSYGAFIGGGGPRIVIVGPVMTSTETPPHITIPFHHEMAYLSKYPSKLFFWCDVPAKEGLIFSLLYSYSHL